MTRRLSLILCLTLSVNIVVTAQDLGFIVGTRHELGIRVPAHDLTDKQGPLCIFCHTPHNSATNIGIWDNHNTNNLFDYPYEAPAETKSAGKPSGASLICLSCHDGIIALGDIFTRAEPVMISAKVNGEITRTDFSDGHPVSFAYDKKLLNENSELANPYQLPDELKLDVNGKLQCTTCHDPHNDRFAHFLVMDNRQALLCAQCHKKPDWKQSSHAVSTARWNHSGPNPWPYSKLGNTVAEYGCQNCHTPHTAGNGKNLLPYNIEEDNCIACHNGNVARHDIQAEFNKFSHHPIEESNGLHDIDEPILMQSSDRHVECVDCHEPHSTTEANDNGLSGGLYNLTGIDINGGEKNVITAEYELCFRCHADSPNKEPMPTPREHDQNNVRLQFDNSNPSFHPVVGPGTNNNVPSLLEPLTENATIKCSDCHAGNTLASKESKLPRGPHGSIYPSILVRQYQTQDNTPESPSSYSLCYFCHDRDSILGDESFREHKLHIQDDSTSCNVCHDPHGVSLIQGNSINNTHLINFDTSVVFRNANGERRFEDNGVFSGTCFLRCHNSDHNDFAY